MAILTPDHTILGLLAERPRHGYELLEPFRQPSQLGRVWKLSTSQIYAVLKRLDSQGWIAGEIVTDHLAPPRTEYTLTETGRAELDRWLYDDQPSASIRRIRVEFLSRLFVAQALGLPIQPLVTHQRSVCIQERERLHEARTVAEPGIEAIALNLQISQVEAVLDWLTEIETTLIDLAHPE